MKKEIHVDEVLMWGVCQHYREEEPKDAMENVYDLFGRDGTFGWRDIVEKHDDVSEIMWWLLREEFLSARRLHLLACDFVKRVIRIMPETYRYVVEAALRTKCRWVDGDATEVALAAAVVAVGAIVTTNTPEEHMKMAVMAALATDPWPMWDDGLGSNAAHAARAALIALRWAEGWKSRQAEEKAQLDMVIAALELEE